MDDARSVSGVKRVGDVDGDREQNLRFQRPPGDAMLQRHPVQKLHDDERLTFVLADLVDRADVGMVQSRAARASRRKRSRACGSLATSSGRNFRATNRPSRCPRPCRPHPCRRRRVSRRCGSARWFGRSLARILRPENGQVNERPRVGTVSRRFVVETSPLHSLTGVVSVIACLQQLSAAQI